ncbi:MAG: shikimate dehydrogenase [Archangium sp.]|nr:shikimate dehydrogenase [Archangium sp.]
MPLARFLAALERGLRARRVVTLPPSVKPTSFAQRARACGADLLEVRTDVTPLTVELHGAADVLPLLVAERGSASPDAWLEAATLVDREASTTCDVRSFHSSTPLTVADALTHWRDVPASVQLKHVEPLHEPRHLATLLETQAALIERHGPERVTVLATGPLATAARAVLAQRNALDYLRFDETWAAAPGQRFLADAVREAQSPTRAPRRLAILGSAVQHSRSPRLHRQPFDRLELPADVDLDALLEALRPHYRGFAVTNPFKKQAARSVGAALPAVNTLLASPTGWAGENTDVAGAAAVLEALGASNVTALGDGGATEALRVAATARGTTLTVLTRAAITSTPIRGACVWTWPASVEIPEVLRFSGAEVAVIAYGPPGRRIAQQIRGRGGTPRALGPRWLIAQARRQKALWEGVR